MYQIKLLGTQNYISAESQAFLDSYDGNVDLLNRPLVSGKKMQAAGWNDVPVDDTATVFSSTFSAGDQSQGYDYNFNQNVIIDITPIRSDGSVLSPSSLESYIQTVITSSIANSRTLMQEDAQRYGIFLRVASVTGSLDNAYAEDETWTVALHDQQEEYYLTFHASSIYDQSQMDTLSVNGPKCTLELNNPGSLSFTLMPDHPLFNTLEPLSSFIQVLDDGEEIFYGKIKSRSEPKITGQVSFTCEGAIGFLQDSEVPPDAKNSSGGTQSRKMKAKDFFTWCIQKHNEDVDDFRRKLTVGNITASKKEERADYSITSYTQTKSAIESNILNVYGGFLKIRSANHGRVHYIDWVQDYGDLNPQTVAIGENIVDQTNEIDATSMFTVLRPIGNNGVKLSEETIDLYPAADMAKYGRIVKTIEFKAANNETELRTAANKYKESFSKTQFASSSIQLVDMHYIDGTSPKVRLGDRFTHLAGFNGVEMIASTLELDFENVQNSRMDVKNRKSLDPDATDNGHATNKMSRASRGSSQMALKYIHELQDKVDIDVADMEMRIDNLGIYVTETFTETAARFERISSRVDNVEQLFPSFQSTLNGVQYNVETILGTAVIQNSETIANLAGHFQVYTDSNGNTFVKLVDGTSLTVSDTNGHQVNVGKSLNETIEKVGDIEVFTQEIEGSALWTQRDKVTGVVGNYDIVRTPDPNHPGQVIEKLVIKSGGGMVIERDGVQYGLYDSGNLTGGLMARKINNQTETLIAGNRVVIGNIDDITGKNADQWFKDAADGEGVFAKFLMVKDLKAEIADISALGVQELTVGSIDNPADIDLYGNITSMGIGTFQEVSAGEVYGETVYANELRFGDEHSSQVMNIIDITKSADGKTLTIIKAFGDPITFEKAVSGGKVSGTWSGNALTVSIDENGESQYTQRVDVRFGYDSSTGKNYIEAYRYKTSATPGNTYAIANTKQEYKLGLSSDLTKVEIQYNSGSAIANTPAFTIPLQEKTISDAGSNWITPDSGNVGFSRVKVSGLVKASTVKPGFINRDGKYYITSYTTDTSGNYTFHNSVEYSLAVSGTKVVINTSAYNQTETQELSIPLQTLTLKDTASDWITPDEGKVGFSKVKTSGLLKSSSILCRFLKQDDKYYINAYYNDASGNPVSVKSKEIKMILDGNMVKITNSSGTVLGGAPKLSVLQRYKDGWADGQLKIRISPTYSASLWSGYTVESGCDITKTLTTNNSSTVFYFRPSVVSYGGTGYTTTGAAKTALKFTVKVNVPVSTPSYAFSGISASAVDGTGVGTATSGYTVHNLSRPSFSSSQALVIKFAVDGKKHAFVL